MATIGVTDVGNTKQALVSSIVQEVISEKAQLLPLVMDYSGQAQPGAASLGIPRRGTFSAGSAIAEDASLTGQAMTFGVDTISFDHYAIRAEISDMARVQSSVDVPAEVVKELGEAMARKVDDLILAQLKLASSASPDHLITWTDNTNDDFELADATNARKLLRSNGKVMFDGDTYCLVSPEQEEHLLKLDNIIDANKYGNEFAIQRGELGSIYGFRLIVSDLLAADEAIFFHKSACAVALQQNFKLEFDRDLSKLNDVYVMSMIGGAKVLAEGKRNVYLAGAHT